jgi:hypothetical protein
MVASDGLSVLVPRDLFVRMARHAVDRTFDVGSVVDAEASVATVIELAALRLFPDELRSELPDWLRESIERVEAPHA